MSKISLKHTLVKVKPKFSNTFSKKQKACTNSFYLKFKKALERLSNAATISKSKARLHCGLCHAFIFYVKIDAFEPASLTKKFD